MAEKFDETKLKALIAEEISNAEGYADSELTPSRERALRYYNGEVPDVPVVKGRSQYISRDVSNVVGWVLPDIMRVFTASDRIVDCLPETEKDEEFTDQAADYLNYCFWRDNPGYQIMRDATWDSLVNKDGIVKQYWEIKEECKYSTYTGMSEDDIAVLMMEDNSGEEDESSSYFVKVEIVEKSKGYTQLIPVIEEPEPVMPEMEPQGLVDLPPADHMGLPQDEVQQPIMAPPVPEMMPEASPEPVISLQEEILFDIKVKRTTRQGRLAYRTVKPECFLTDTNAVDLVDNWRFQAERYDDVTRSDLIKMGFDPERVNSIPAFSASGISTEDLARRDIAAGQYDNPQTAMERVDLYECYAKVDINGDGMAEIIKVMYAGDSGGHEVLDWEEWDDETPYDKIPCNPVPHRMASDSLADEVMDIQRFKTVVGRQMFDNLYQSNTPQPVVQSNKVKNMDAVVNRGIGVPIITDDINAIRWDVTPFIGDKALLMMQHLDDTMEMRTGVSRAAMSLDPEVLQNQTATASNNGRDARRSQVELITRDQAELGWKPVFKKSLKIMVKNQDRPRTIKLRDKWVDMDPRQWNISMDVEVNVGLGTGSRDRDMAMLNNILNTQIADMERLAASGFVEEAIDMLPKIIKTQIKIAEAAGIKSPETFYPEISPEELKAMKAKAKEQASAPSPQQQEAQAKLQAEQQQQQAQLAMDADKTKAEMALEAQKQASQERMRQMEIQAEMQLKREQMQMEIQLKREQLTAELELKRNMAMLGYQGSASGVGGVHVGGAPG